MHVPGRHPRACPDLVPGPVLHVHSDVPVPRAIDDVSENDCLGAASFSLTAHRQKNGLKIHIFCNFGTVIRTLYAWKPPVPVPKAQDRRALTYSRDPIQLTGNREYAVENQFGQREFRQ